MNHKINRKYLWQQDLSKLYQNFETNKNNKIYPY